MLQNSNQRQRHTNQFGVRKQKPFLKNEMSTKSPKSKMENKVVLLIISLIMSSLAFSSCGDKDDEVIIPPAPTPTELSVPTDVTATQSGSSIVISWSSVLEATNYKVYRCNTASGTYSYIGSPNSTSYTDNSPLNGENFYKVAAVNNTGESNQSSYVSCIYSASGGTETGLYLGIIGFNDVFYEEPISLLTNFSTVNNKNKFQTHINTKLATKANTGLYWAVDNAIKRLQNATLPDDLETVAIVTFTDGLDNASPFLNDAYFGKDNEVYRDDVKKLLTNTKIKNKPITAYSIGIRGGDVQTTADYTEFLANLPKLANPDNNGKEAKDMAEVNSRFSEIAKSLYSVSRSQNLRLVFPGNVVNSGGKIRFTFDLPANEIDAKKSNLYIEGTYNINGTAITFKNLVYKGLKTSSGSTVTGERTNIADVSFAFEGITLDSGGSLDGTNTRQWYMRASDSQWSHNSEFDGKESVKTEVNAKSAVIMLVLDCTTSLDYNNANGFSQMKSAANKFINGLVSGDFNGGAQIRFSKNVDFSYLSTFTDMKIYPIDNYENTLAIHTFGSSNGTSPYYDVSSGSVMYNIYMVNYGGDPSGWYYWTAFPGPYTLSEGHKYTLDFTFSNNTAAMTLRNEGAF